jgi:competence protein ComGC
MLKKANNEKGYALVSVLLIVVVFSIVFLSFMGQAFSSTKQNQIVEKKTQSVAAAEMGVSFYQVAVQDTYEKNQVTVGTYVKGLMSQPDSSTRDYKREAALKMAELIQSQIPTISTPSNAPFAISNFVSTVDSADLSSHEIEISFDITGTAEGKTTKISAEMTIDVGGINNDGSTAPTSSYEPPSFSTVPIPDAKCTSFETKKTGSSADDEYCNEILVGNGYVTPKINGQGLSGKTIYSTGSITLDSNANNSLNLTVHAEGPVTVDKNMNSSSTLFLETKSDATFEGQIRLNTSSKLFIGGNLSNTGGTSGDNGNHFSVLNSTIYVGGNATLNKVTIDDKSRMCVYGNLSAYSISSLEDNLYVLGTVTINNQPKDTYRVLPNETQANREKEFFKKCGKFIPGEFKINWGDTIDTELDNVEY